MNMDNHPQAERSSAKRRRLHRLRSMRGSRRGYSADVDGSPACSCDEDEATASSGHMRGHLPFYSHVRPRRRGKNRRGTSSASAESGAHPDIDLSLVSLLSSKELDRRFGLYHYESSANSSTATTPSSSEGGNGSSSESTTTGQVSETIIRKDKGCGSLLASSRPLAVVDYGSIDLDMSGTLLDSIYKIGGRGSGGTEDLLIGGRRYSQQNDERWGDGDRVADKAVGDGLGEDEGSLPSFTIASSRSHEVEAVIASLKNVPTSKRARAYSAEGPGKKKQKTALARRGSLPIVDKEHTSLEGAISFSPFARVLFCAQSPHTVVHTNAAYSALVQQGLALPCKVGEPFTSHERREVESPEDHIARAAAEHIGAVSSDGKGSPVPSRKLPGFVHIFPVVSNDETCSQFVRSYERNLWHRRNSDVDARRDIADATPSSHDPRMPRPAKASPSRCNQYRSHYLLQIEPSSVQLP